MKISKIVVATVVAQVGLTTLVVANNTRHNQAGASLASLACQQIKANPERSPEEIISGLAQEVTPSQRSQAMNFVAAEGKNSGRVFDSFVQNLSIQCPVEALAYYRRWK